jgi:lysozyme
MIDQEIRYIIELEEGWRDKPYYCSEGYPTVGYGFKIGEQFAPLPEFTLPRPAGDAWLSCNIRTLRKALGNRVELLNDARQAIILSMCYQLGVEGCFKFKKMWRAIENDDYEAAAKEMLDSKWAKQTPSRAARHEQVMRTGLLWPTYKVG